MLVTVFDTSPLITACKFELRGQPIIDHLLAANCRIIVPSSVQAEITAELHRYPDAKIAAERIRNEQVLVRNVIMPSENVMDLYSLGYGEQAAIALAFVLKSEINHVVLDEKLAYIVCDRLNLPKLFFLDLVLTLVEKNGLSKALGREIIDLVAPRYSFGMVEHSLKILERGERKWLW
jgi:predicted nucleic acid-binding protein